MKGALEKFYQTLLAAYGPQGWWPLLELERKDGIQPTKSGSVRGYHPSDYSYPRTERQRFEICVGAILTQNTAWPNVEKALVNLEKKGMIDPKKIMSTKITTLSTTIKSAGYFNQKAKKLKIFSEFYNSLNGRTPTRDELLGIWGVGPETADSILLYAYKQPEFVVDAYTRRIMVAKGLIQEKYTYDEIKQFLEQSLDKDYALYQEFHALLVEHAKREKARINQ